MGVVSRTASDTRAANASADYRSTAIAAPGPGRLTVRSGGVLLEAYQIFAMGSAERSCMQAPVTFQHIQIAPQQCRC